MNGVGEGECPQRLEEILHRLARIRGVEAASIAREDGLVVAHQLPSDLDAKKMAAMAAALLGTGTRVAEELNRGCVQHCWLHCDRGKVIAYRTPGSTLLIALLSEKANVGFVQMAMEEAIEEMHHAFSSLLAVDLD